MKKYNSPLTAALTHENWKDKINPADLSLDDAMDLLRDLKVMEAFGKKVGGFMKEVVRSRIPDNETTYSSPRFVVVLNDRVRTGDLDMDKVTEEMGVEWVNARRKPSTEYTELRLSPVTEEE